MTSPISDLINLAKLWHDLQTQLPEMAKRAEVERASGWLKMLCDEYPQAAEFVKSMLVGTPQEVIQSLKAWSIDLTGCEHFVSQLQEKLRVELKKPRPSLGPRQQRR